MEEVINLENELMDVRSLKSEVMKRKIINFES